MAEFEMQQIPPFTQGGSQEEKEEKPSYIQCLQARSETSTGNPIKT